MAAGAAAMLLFALMNALAKHLSETYSVVEIAFYRNLVALVPFLIFALLPAGRGLFRIHHRPGLLLLRAVLGSLTLMVTFAAFAAMPMAETSVLLFTASLFLPVLGAVFLKESVGPWRWSAVVIGFLGVAMMLRPEAGLNGTGVGIAITAALLQAVMGILLRRLGGFERPETIALYFFMTGVLVTGAIMPFVAIGPSADDIPWFIATGLVGAGAQWMLTVAYRHVEAAVVAVLNYTGLVWATLLGWLLFSDWPTVVVFVGSAVVIGANLLIVWRERQLGRRRVATQGA